jgi:hypothetical protein
MVRTKKMDEGSFASLVKELNAVGEVIRTRQDEKQAVIDEFRMEKRRYSTGKISETTLHSSVRKTNQELARLDNDVRNTIKKISALGIKLRNFAAKQAPKTLRAKMSGVGYVGISKKKRSRRSRKR